MKNIIILLTFSVFASCNNSSTPAVSDNAAEAQHNNTETTKIIDTTAILPDQKVSFGNLKDGQEIKLPYVVKFKVEGMNVVPAMGVVANEGHHHLFVDQESVPANTMVPMQKESEGYFHFGKGQLMDTLNIKKYTMLTPGKHTLTLQFANGMHMSYGPAMSAQVQIIVK